MAPPIRPAAAALLLGAAIGRVVAPGDATTVAAWASVGAATVVAAVLAAGRRWSLATATSRRMAMTGVALLAFAAGSIRAAATRPAPLGLPDLAVAEATAVALAAPEPLGPRPPVMSRTAGGTAGGGATGAAGDADDGAVTRVERRGWGFRADVGDVVARVTFDLGPDESPPDVLPGDAVRVVGRVRPTFPPANPGTGRRPAAPVEIEAASIVVVRRGAATPALAVRRWGEVLRQTLRRRIADACGGETAAAGVLSCVLTGDRSGLAPETSRAFRDSGTAHVLAVSGLHLVLLVALFAAAGRRFAPRAARRRFGIVAVAAVVIVYTAVCRFETPVVRSAVFLLVGAAARSAQRRTSTLDHLALAAILVVAVDPDQVVDVGFQLSFAAVAGLTLLTSRFRGALFPRLRILLRFPEAMSRRRLRAFKALANALATSFAAQAATAPVVAATFGTAQPLGPVANLVAVPLFSAVLPFTIALAAIGGLAPGITSVAAEVAAAAFVGTADVAASVPLGHLALGRPPPWLLAAGIALLAAGARTPDWRRRDLWVPALAWAVVALGPGGLAQPAVAECTTLDVGHGLAVVVRAADGTALLYDAGGRSPGLGDRTIVPALRATGVRRLAFLCLSHEDSDHCGAAEAIVREIEVGTVVVPAGFGVSPLARSVLDACRDRGVPVAAMLAGDRLVAGGLSAVALHPSVPALAGAENEDSLVLHVVADDETPLTVLLTGDVEGASLDALAARRDLPPARVLVLPHHGRGPPWSHARLADAARAELLIASGSDPATVGVPAAWVTGACGAVRVRSGRAPEAWPWDEP